MENVVDMLSAEAPVEIPVARPTPGSVSMKYSAFLIFEPVPEARFPGRTKKYWFIPKPHRPLTSCVRTTIRWMPWLIPEPTGMLKMVEMLSAEVPVEIPVARPTPGSVSTKYSAFLIFEPVPEARLPGSTKKY